jgi:drug/metabolite transporter (DMT)-like permease
MTGRNKGILYMVLSSLFFAMMAASVKLAGDLPTLEKVFFRNVVGFAASGYLIYRTRGSYLGNDRIALLYRSFFGLVGLVFYFYAIDRLPLANAVILNQMNPFFTLILAFMFLQERVVKLQWLAIFTALAGVAFILRPGLDYHVLPAVIGLLSAVFSAAAYTTIRHLRLTDHPQTIIFYFTGVTTFATLPFMFFGHFVMPDGVQFASLLAVGIFATVAQFFMTNAYRYCEAGDLSIYSYGNAIFAIFIGIFLWREFPHAFSLLGVLLVLGGAYMNYQAKREKIGVHDDCTK